MRKHTIENFKLGDVIYTARQWGDFRPSTELFGLDTEPINYFHYGIYVGDDEVIHFKDKSTIEQTNMDVFTEGGIAWVDKEVERIFTRKEVVKRAKENLGSDFGGYSLLRNNCEHFTTYCARGVKFSRQVSPLSGKSCEDLGVIFFDAVINGIVEGFTADLGEI